MRLPAKSTMPLASRIGGMLPATSKRVLLTSKWPSASSASSGTPLPRRPGAVRISRRLFWTTPPNRLASTQSRAPEAAKNGQSCLTWLTGMLSMASARSTPGDLPAWKCTAPVPIMWPNGVYAVIWSATILCRSRPIVPARRICAGTGGSGESVGAICVSRLINSKRYLGSTAELRCLGSMPMLPAKSKLERPASKRALVISRRPVPWSIRAFTSPLPRSWSSSPSGTTMSAKCMSASRWRTPPRWRKPDKVNFRAPGEKASAGAPLAATSDADGCEEMVTLNVSDGASCEPVPTLPVKAKPWPAIRPLPSRSISPSALRDSRARSMCSVASLPGRPARMSRRSISRVPVPAAATAVAIRSTPSNTNSGMRSGSISPSGLASFCMSPRPAFPLSMVGSKLASEMWALPSRSRPDNRGMKRMPNRIVPARSSGCPVLRSVTATSLIFSAIRREPSTERPVLPILASTGRPSARAIDCSACARSSVATDPGGADDIKPADTYREQQARGGQHQQQRQPRTAPQREACPDAGSARGRKGIQTRNILPAKFDLLVFGNVLFHAGFRR